MKRAGILNFQYSTHNYGAVLQAAALEEICRQLGYEASHINYIAAPRVTYRSVARKVLQYLGFGRVNNVEEIGNTEAFELFRREFITRTPRLRSPKEFNETSKNFNSVIVGSDQVWRPEYARDAVAFFLGYVPEGVNRISYAASFGTEKWEYLSNAYLTSIVKKELKKFKAISCREESGVLICKETFEVDAVHVLDPLLLIGDEFFYNICKKSVANVTPRLVFYKLDSSEEFREDLMLIEKHFKSESLDLYYKDTTEKQYREVFDWLRLLLESETVVTDSFHCVCISLRFGKKIIYSPNLKRGNTRLESLFKMLEIETIDLPFKSKSPMFFLSGPQNLDEILTKTRKKSLDFLSSALSE